MKEEYKVIIAGSRDFNDYDLLCYKCEKILSHKMLTHDVVVVSGTARGADTLGEQFAITHDLNIERHPAEWEKYGRSAGYRRNAEMTESANALIAFWDGQSKGTGHMIDLAKERNLDIRIILV